MLPFETNWRNMLSAFSGIGNFHKRLIMKRLELVHKSVPSSLHFALLSKEVLRSFNRLLSQMSSINYQIQEIQRLNLIRLFLIKSFRGRAQAMGKPSRGQRT